MSDLDEQSEIRRAKRQRLAEAGVATYPHRFEFDAETSDVHARYGEKTAEELEAAAVRLRVPGRIKAIRGQGKIAFLDLHDGKKKLQLFVKRDRLPEAAAALLDQLDLGDWIGAAGTVMRTRAGELSLAVDDLTFLSKALHPM